MSADGEINVQVRAEGADDAADELAQRGGGDGGGGGGGGLTGALRGAGVLAILASVLDLLGPVGDFLDAIFNILKAFLAPIGLIIFRLLSPVLRLLISILPAWFDLTREIDSRMQTFIETLGDARNRIQDIVSNTDSLNDLPGALLSFEQVLASLLPRELKELRAIIILSFRIIKRGIQDFLAGLRSGIDKLIKRVAPKIPTIDEIGRELLRIASGLTATLLSLPEIIAREIGQRLPNLPSAGGVGDAAEGAFDRFTGGGDSTNGGVSVNIAGGLGAFIDRIESDQSLDL